MYFILISSSPFFFLHTLKGNTISEQELMRLLKDNSSSLDVKNKGSVLVNDTAVGDVKDLCTLESILKNGKCGK